MYIYHYRFLPSLPSTEKHVQYKSTDWLKQGPGQRVRDCCILIWAFMVALNAGSIRRMFKHLFNGCKRKWRMFHAHCTREGMLLSDFQVLGRAQSLMNQGTAFFRKALYHKQLPKCPVRLPDYGVKEKGYDKSSIASKTRISVLRENVRVL